MKAVIREIKITRLISINIKNCYEGENAYFIA